MKLIYDFDENCSLKDVLQIASELENETGLIPLYIEENGVFCEYNAADIELLNDQLIDETTYKERNLIGLE